MNKHINKIISSTVTIVSVNLVKLFKKSHSWMIKPPEYKAFTEGLILIILGINGLILSEKLVPNISSQIGNSSLATGIFILVLSVMLWGFLGIYKTISSKKIEVGIKYRFLLHILLCPCLLLINGAILYIKNLDCNNEKQQISTSH